MVTQQKKTFTQLGYSPLETAEIVIQLNRLLASYSVYQQKLRDFYWNITGQDFFELNNLFKNMYQRTIDETDTLAKRIRLFGHRPASSFSEYLKLSEITEEKTEATSFEMAKIALKDIRILLGNMEQVMDAAKEINDNGTEYILKSFIYNMEQEHWMLTSWVKQKV